MVKYNLIINGNNLVIEQDEDGYFVIPENLKCLGTGLKPAHEDWILGKKEGGEEIEVDSKFVYMSKPSGKDKNEGLDKPQTHPTVKSTKLMSYLINMITPPKGIVLDPFMGSGTTGVAAVRNGYNFIGIEMEEEYFNIAKTRINYTNEKKSN